MKLDSSKKNILSAILSPKLLKTFDMFDETKTLAGSPVTSAMMLILI